MGSLFTSIFNKLLQSSFGRKVLNWLGITPNRPLPPLAKTRFSAWYKKHYRPIEGHKKVVLFNDTYTEFNEPELGIAALKVLTALGYHVILPPWKCCGRPMISKGVLKKAKKQALALIDLLTPYAKEGLPIIGLEPSCLLTFKDEFKDLHLGEGALPLIEASITFDEFVAQHIQNGKLPLILKLKPQEVKLHGHCHQKALLSTTATQKVLRAIPGFEVEEIDSGCCGMAGSFGYEKEHYDFSMKIAELKLLPAVRNSSTNTLFVANGVSCRTQIQHGTGRKALHLAELLAQVIYEEPTDAKQKRAN